MHRYICCLLAGLTVGAGLPANAEGTRGSVELFGTLLKGATRDQLRTAFKAGGLQPERVDDSYWIDLYKANGVLDEASSFKAGYTQANNTFAFAQYTFNAFMDTALVTRVAKLVSSKYGKADWQSGTPRLGSVVYRWHLPQGMLIEVSRGWPDTTTYMTFTDPTNKRRLDAEIAQAQAERDQLRAKAQSKAF